MRGWKKRVIAVVAAGAGLTAVLYAYAAPENPDRVVISGRVVTIAGQQRAMKEAQAQSARARRRSEEMEARASQATADADRLNARAAAAAARIQEAEADIREGQARIAIVNRLIADQQSRLAVQQQPLVRLTAALQSLSRRPATLSVLQPGSLKDTVHVRAVFSQLLPVIDQRTADLRGELAKARGLKADALAANAMLKTSRQRLADTREALGRLEAEKRVAARGLSSGASLEAERATALGEQARDIGDLMSELQVAGDVRQRLARLPVPPLRPSATTSSALPSPERPEGSSPDPAYRLPVVGSIVNGFGELSDSGVRSRGLTVATEPGAQVVAPARARIVFAGPYKGFGQIVILDHGDGWSSLIADLGRLTASVGQTVTSGSPIGIARTGASPTVILELRRQGRPVDILAMAGAGL